MLLRRSKSLKVLYDQTSDGDFGWSEVLAAIVARSM
jgi:hypothetical protein